MRARKGDSSHDSTSKKTPKRYIDKVSWQEKTLDLVLNTMATLTQKLEAMEQKISGLAQKIEPNSASHVSLPYMQVTLA